MTWGGAPREEVAEEMGCHWCASDKGGGRGHGLMGREQRGKGGWWWDCTVRRAKLREEALASWTDRGGWAE